MNTALVVLVVALLLAAAFAAGTILGYRRGSVKGRAEGKAEGEADTLRRLVVNRNEVCREAAHVLEVDRLTVAATERIERRKT